MTGSDFDWMVSNHALWGWKAPVKASVSGISLLQLSPFFASIFSLFPPEKPDTQANPATAVIPFVETTRSKCNRTPLLTRSRQESMKGHFIHSWSRLYSHRSGGQTVTINRSFLDSDYRLPNMKRVCTFQKEEILFWSSDKFQDAKAIKTGQERVSLHPMLHLEKERSAKNTTLPAPPPDSVAMIWKPEPHLPAVILCLVTQRGEKRCVEVES